MIGILTHHWAKPNLIEQAKELLDTNGEAQKLAKGFISRQTLISLSDKTKISSIVAWESEEVYDLWKSSSQRFKIMAQSGSFWAKPPVSERFRIE